MVNPKIIQEHMENIIHHLQPLLPLANFHMVDYFTKEAYKNFIPEDIQLEIKNTKVEDVASNIFNNDYKHMPNLFKYHEKSRRLTLKNCDNICLSMEQFQERLIDWGCEEFLRLKLNIFMTSKKSHEVDVLSFFSAAIHNISNTSHIIDIGDGKGYLSSMLALHYQIPVLGVDASIINTNGAVQRVKKLSKIWNSVVNKENKKTKETSANLYKQATQFVHENINFNELIENVFLEKPKGIDLVGLHTCGNLAATSVRIFSASEHIRTICNVGCCYHHLTESFELDPKRKEHLLVGNGFPMSKYLTEKQFVIGRAARMIAAQSVERILHKKELPNRTLFYRALFEVLVEKHCVDVPPTQRQVGRFRKECVSFLDYARRASERLRLNLESVSDEEIEDLFDEYKHRLHELNNFYLIRCMLAPVVEHLILLDRLLFLQEQGYQKSFLVQLFDPVVSPRCYGLIAIK